MQSKKTSLSVAGRRERQGEASTLLRGVIHFCHTAFATEHLGTSAQLGVCLCFSFFIRVIVRDLFYQDQDGK